MLASIASVKWNAAFVDNIVYLNCVSLANQYNLQISPGKLDFLEAKQICHKRNLFEMTCYTTYGCIPGRRHLCNTILVLCNRR